MKKTQFLKVCALGALMTVLMASSAQALVPVNEVFISLESRIENAQYHPKMRISADVEYPNRMNDAITVYSANLVPLYSQCDLTIFSASDVVKEDKDEVMGVFIFDFADGAWVNITNGGSAYYFSVNGKKCSQMLDNAGDYAVEWTEGFPLSVEEAERRSMEQVEKMGIPYCAVADRKAYAENESGADPGFAFGQIQLKQVVDGIPFVQSLLHLTGPDAFVVGNILFFTLTEQGFEIIDVFGAYENCVPLYQVEEIASLPEALDTLNAYLDTFFAKREGIRDLEIFRIAFEYVPYRTNPWEEDAAEYETIPAWHFGVRVAGSSRDGAAFDFCVSALDGKMLIY